MADPVLPAVEELKARDAVRMLAEGRLPGARGAAFSFLNPHFSGVTDTGRTEILRTRHEQLFSHTRVFLFNTAAGSPETTADRLLELAGQ
jgi:hypothetical protein